MAGAPQASPPPLHPTVVHMQRIIRRYIVLLVWAPTCVHQRQNESRMVISERNESQDPHLSILSHSRNPAAPLCSLVRPFPLCECITRLWFVAVWERGWGGAARPWELQAIKMSFGSPNLIGCFISIPPPPACTKCHNPFSPALWVRWGGCVTQPEAAASHAAPFQLLLAARAPVWQTLLNITDWTCANVFFLENVERDTPGSLCWTKQP